MKNDNIQKKKHIDDILTKYSENMAVVTGKRDKIVAEFLDIIKTKKLEELRNSLEQL